MPTNVGRKNKGRRKPAGSAPSRGDEEQLQSRTKQATESGPRSGAAERHVSVSSPAARAAESATPRGETELPFKGWPAQAEAGRPRGRLLDAWHATYSSPLIIGLLKSRPPVVEAALEFVSDPDDRQQVTDTTAFPYRCICFLIITAADGTLWQGTGWFASPRLVVTAGHDVFSARQGGWAKQIEVFPACNGNDTPFGSSVSSDFRSVKGWVEALDPDTPDAQASDYGAILLPESSPVGYFGYASLSDTELQSMLVNVYGYPSDKPDRTLWGHYRLLSQLGPRQLFFKISTAAGQAGSPVFIKEGDHR